MAGESTGGALGDGVVRVGLQWENDLATLNAAVNQAKQLLQSGLKDSKGIKLQVDEAHVVKQVQKILGDLSKELGKVKLGNLDTGSLKAFSTMSAGLAQLTRGFNSTGMSKIGNSFSQLALQATEAAQKVKTADTEINAAIQQVGAKAEPIKIDVDISELKASLGEVSSLLKDTAQQAQALISSIENSMSKVGAVTRDAHEKPHQTDAAAKKAEAQAIKDVASARKADTEASILAAKAAITEADARQKNAKAAEAEATAQRQAEAQEAAQRRTQEASSSFESTLQNAQSLSANKISAYAKMLGDIDTRYRKISEATRSVDVDAGKWADNQTKQISKLRAELERLQSNTKYDIQNNKGQWLPSSGSAEAFLSDMRQAASSYGVLVQGSEQYSLSAQRWRAIVQGQNGDLIRLNATMDASGSGYRLMETHLSASASAFQKVGITIKDIAGNYIRYFSGQQMVTRVVSELRQGWTEIKELDTAYTELRKVSDESTAALQAFRQESFNIADQAVSTGKAIQQSAADWARLGYAIDDASQLAKNTSIYANVGEMDIETATEHMISTVKAFKDEFSSDGEASAQIADIFNELDNNFAITAEGLGAAMERAAAAMVAANNDIHESAALVTAGNTIAQNPELVGNTIKVVSMRIRGAKAELEELGEETDGMIESTSKLRDEIKALSGVDIMRDANTFKSTYEILDEISQVYDKLSDVSQANLLETLAGKLRGSTVAGLLNNFDIAREALDAARNSAGSAAAENEAYAQSIEGHLTKLANTWEQIWGNSASREGVNFFIDLANGASEVVNQVGLLNTAIGVLFGALSAKSGVGRGQTFPLLNMPTAHRWRHGTSMTLGVI